MCAIEETRKTGWAYGWTNDGKKILINRSGFAETQSGPREGWKKATKTEIKSVRKWEPSK